MPPPDWRRTLVEATARYRAERGYPPSIRELVERTGAGSTSVVAYRLAACEREGLLVREPRLARAITLTAPGRALAGSPPEGESPVRAESAVGGRAAWRDGAAEQPPPSGWARSRDRYPPALQANIHVVAEDARHGVQGFEARAVLR